MLSKHNNINLSWAVIPICFAIIVAVGVYLMMWFQPQICEDMEYALADYDRKNGVIDFINWEGIWNHILSLYNDCNSRLIDKFSVVFLCLMPRWLYSALTAFVAILILTGMWRLGRISLSKKPWIALAAGVAFLLLFPWHESMFMLSYSLNYFWTSAIALWFAIMILSAKAMGAKGYGAATGFFLLGFLLGNLHEGMTVGIMAALFFVAIYSHGVEARNRWILCGGIATGMAFSIFLFATAYRISYTEFGLDFKFLFGGRHHTPSLLFWPVVLYTTIALYRWLIYPLNSKHKFFAGIWNLTKNYLREIFSTKEKSDLFLQQTICLSVSWITSMMLPYVKAERIMAFAVVFSIAGCFGLIASWQYKSRKIISTILKAVTCIYAIILTTNLVLNILMQRRNHKEWNEICLLWEESEDGIAYYDNATVLATPWYPLHTYQMHYNLLYDNCYHTNAFLRPHKRYTIFYVLPTDLKDFSASKIEWVDKEQGIYRLGKHLLIEPRDMNFDTLPREGTFHGDIHINMDAEFSDGNRHRVWGALVPFTDKEGVKRYYIKLAQYSPQEIENEIVTVNDIVINPAAYYPIMTTSYDSIELFPYADKKKVGGA